VFGILIFYTIVKNYAKAILSAILSVSGCSLPFTKTLPSNAHVIREASGPYYLQLAIYLHKHGYAISVINALSIRHFIRMRMHRSKTDQKLQQAETLADGLTRQCTQLKNMREAFTSSGFTDTCALAVIKEQIESIEQQVAILEKYMVELTEIHHADLFERVKSIPGLGKRNVMMLIVITNGFTKFENSKQLVAYVGLDPGVYTSGTSVHGSKE
jgi:transposase